MTSMATEPSGAPESALRRALLVLTRTGLTFPTLRRRSPCSDGLAQFALLAAAFSALAGCAGGGPVTPAIVVGAAASLRPVVEALADGFDAEVTVVAGSSGALAAQVRQGAPIDLFISADDRFTAELARDGFLRAESVVELARGELTAVTTLRDSPTDAAKVVASGDVRRVALANPELAPYGAAARRYLRDAGVWNVIDEKVVFGENAAHALQFVASGSAEIGFVPLSLALSSGGASLRRLDALPAEVSAGLVVTAGVVKGSANAKLAERFAAHARSAAGAAAWGRYGYVPLDGEESAS